MEPIRMLEMFLASSQLLSPLTASHARSPLSLMVFGIPGLCLSMWLLVSCCTAAAAGLLSMQKKNHQTSSTWKNCMPAYEYQEGVKNPGNFKFIVPNWLQTGSKLWCDSDMEPIRMLEMYFCDNTAFVTADRFSCEVSPFFDGLRHTRSAYLCAC